MPSYATSIDIEAPPEVVFEHLTRAERMVEWMGEHAVLEPRPGGRFAVDIQGYLVRGEYLEVDPPNRLVVSWGMDGAADLPPGLSRVEFTLERTAMGTHLSLSHSGLPETRAIGHAAGWTHYLARMQLAATGIKTAPDTWTGPPNSNRE
jgi:uncharacterized protein YndB with AHSA1/START domain